MSINLEPRTAEELEQAAQLEEALARWAPSVEPICHFCRHLLSGGGMSCAAYPDGIPWEIQAGQVDHRLPYANDRGVQYDPLTPEEFRARAAELRAEAARLRQRGAADWIARQTIRPPVAEPPPLARIARSRRGSETGRGMRETRADTASPERAAALAAFHPERFGFRAHGNGWVKEFAGLGPVAVTALGWPHAQSLSYDRDAAGERVAMDPLNLVVWLQAKVWGMPPDLLVPSNILAIIPDSGGSVLAAYELRRGFNADGWLGFIIGFGARSGTLVSHMLGVREDARGTRDLGWYLKLIQGYEALRAGHEAMIWTFDPMRGANARLNMEKLGATVGEFTLDKYGVLRTTLYGEVPSDRFTAHWDLLAPRTRDRIAQVRDGGYRALAPSDVSELPEATPATLASLLAARPECVRYRIPGDIDALMRDDPPAAIRWREEMRTVLAALMTTKRAKIDAAGNAGPIADGYDAQPGAYVITGFATGPAATGERVSFYVLERNPAPT